MSQSLAGFPPGQTYLLKGPITCVITPPMPSSNPVPNLQLNPNNGY